MISFLHHYQKTYQKKTLTLSSMILSILINRGETQTCYAPLPELIVLSYYAPKVGMGNGVVEVLSLEVNHKQKQEEYYDTFQTLP